MQTDLTQASIHELLTSTAPAFSAADAVHIAASHYGIRARVRPLVSDRDQNFLLDADDGKRYTLKIANHTEHKIAVDFQNRALLHIAKQDASFPLPRVIPTKDGQLQCSADKRGKTHFVRLLSWVEGVVLNDAISDPGLAKAWKDEGHAGEWGVPDTWQKVQEVTKFLGGKKLQGMDAYGYLDPVKGWGGFGFYFLGSRATAYVCRGQTCSLPITDPGELAAALGQV